MAEEPTPAVWKRVGAAVSLTRVQAIIGTLAGIISIAGALFSVSPFAQAPANGQLVATVQDAGSHRGISDATIEVLTADNHVVATLSADAAGRATQDLKEGAYVVRVSHPRYGADVRRIQVFARQSVEIRAMLHAGASPAGERGANVDRAVNSGVRAIRKALRF